MLRHLEAMLRHRFGARRDQIGAYCPCLMRFPPKLYEFIGFARKVLNIRKVTVLYEKEDSGIALPLAAKVGGGRLVEAEKSTV